MGGIINIFKNIFFYFIHKFPSAFFRNWLRNANEKFLDSDEEEISYTYKCNKCGKERKNQKYKDLFVESCDMQMVAHSEVK